jgi:hypothetical protein
LKVKKEQESNADLKRKRLDEGRSVKKAARKKKRESSLENGDSPPQKLTKSDLHQRFRDAALGGSANRRDRWKNPCKDIESITFCASISP